MFDFKKIETFDIVYNIIISTMKEYYIATYGVFDENVEKEYLLNDFQSYNYYLINNGIGLISYKIENDDLFINELHILKQYQGHGYGSLILKDIIKKSNTDILLEVLKVNTKALKFYQKHNFSIIGENDTHYKMRYKNN